MSNIVNYEVYVYESNAWDLLARYPSEKRGEAIEYAKSVEFSQSKPTKVIRETYDLDTQKFQESLIYLSEYNKVSSLKKKPAPVAYPQLNIKQQKKQVTAVEALGKLFFVISVSLLGSALMATVFLKAVAEIGFVSSDLSSHFVFAMFIMFFLLLSIPMSLRWVPWDVLSGKTSTYTMASPNTSADEPDEPEEKNAIPDEQGIGRRLSRGISKTFFRVWDSLTGASTAAEEEEPSESEPLPPPPPPAPAPEEPEEMQEAEENFVPPEMAENKAAAPEISERPAEAAPAAEEKTTVPKELEKEHILLTTFLATLLKILQQQNVQLDTYARFGIALFISGACEQLSQKHGLNTPQNRTLLCSMLEVMGTSKDIAELFHDKIGEYALEPKYLPLIQGGSKAMDVFIQAPAAPETLNTMRQSMTKWLSPDQNAAPQSGIVTVMFTDMVGSTHFTQTLGDRLAQQLIRKHNAIVRQALSACNGREIKLTGDGTMASFSSASNAVDAAIAIQKTVARYNRQSPTVPLEIRIGLNAGEPIIEENDMFGTTVQIAARICNLADRDQIYVSNVVKELSAGKSYHFKDLGEHTLKGINHPQAVYEVLWDEAASEEKAPAAEPVSSPREEKPLEEALPEF